MESEQTGYFPVFCFQKSKKRPFKYNFNWKQLWWGKKMTWELIIQKCAELLFYITHLDLFIFIHKLTRRPVALLRISSVIHYNKHLACESLTTLTLPSLLITDCLEESVPDCNKFPQNKEICILRLLQEPIPLSKLTWVKVQQLALNDSTAANGQTNFSKHDIISSNRHKCCTFIKSHLLSKDDVYKRKQYVMVLLTVKGGQYWYRSISGCLIKGYHNTKLWTEGYIFKPSCIRFTFKKSKQE